MSTNITCRARLKTLYKKVEKFIMVKFVYEKKFVNFATCCTIFTIKHNIRVRKYYSYAIIMSKKTQLFMIIAITRYL